MGTTDLKLAYYDQDFDGEVIDMPDDALQDIPVNDEVDLACECDEWMRIACIGLPFYKKALGKRYCVLHFPSNEKAGDFDRVLNEKLEADALKFCGVFFPGDTDFSEHRFRRAADFRGAHFTKGADFSWAVFFRSAKFSEAHFDGDANFSECRFKGQADFSESKFTAKANFIKAEFGASSNFARAAFTSADFDTTFAGEANFMYATFAGEAYFRYAVFRKPVCFRSASFDGYVRFGEGLFGEGSSLDLQLARIEKPDHVAFYSLRLLPHWFSNVDMRRFDFEDIDWCWNSVGIEQELASLIKLEVGAPHTALARACWQLAENSEERGRFIEASRFRYRAMDVMRRKSWHGFAIWRLSWWYWLASGYGERAWQAALVLVGLWLIFAAIFFVGQRGEKWWRPVQYTTAPSAIAIDANAPDQIRAFPDIREAAIYSLSVMTLQKPEPLPVNKRAKALVLLETILGPVQVALLALAIRRKFMR